MNNNTIRAQKLLNRAALTENPETISKYQTRLDACLKVDNSVSVDNKKKPAINN